MKIVALLFFSVILFGCDPQQHVWDELDRCKAMFGEECTLAAIPVSKSAEMNEIITDWRE